MVIDILIVLIIFILPRGLMVLAKKGRLFNVLGPVFLCYAAGFIISFIIPDTSMAMTLAEVLIPIAIPLILFSCNVVVLKKLARPMLLSFFLNMIAVTAVALAAYYIFRGAVPEAGKISAMLTGLYTGGTPNMMAIGIALGVDSDEIILVNTADMIAGGIYFLLVVAVLIRLFSHILPPYKSVLGPVSKEEEQSLIERYQPEKRPVTRENLKPLALAVLLAVACLAVSAGLALLLTGTLHVAIVMLGVTTLGVAFSFNKRIRNCPGTYNTGQYLIYMFSLAIGMSFDLSALNNGSLLILVMLLGVEFGTVLVHLLLAKLCRVDVHTMLITSIAGIFGPAFVTPTASAMKNDEVILPGLACGIIGYGIGNYLGFLFALAIGVL